MQIVGRCGLPSDIWALSTILWEVRVSQSFTPCCKFHAGRSIMSVLVLPMHLKMGYVKVDLMRALMSASDPRVNLFLNRQALSWTGQHG